MRGQEYGTAFVETASGTGRAIATHAAVAGRTYYITDISGSVDGPSGRIVLRQGTTVIWQDVMATGSSGSVYQYRFNVPLSGALGAAVSLDVGTATNISYANIAGYEL